MTWTGSNLAAVDRDVAGIWDPDRAQWRRLPNPPDHLAAIHAVWTGRDLVIIGISCSHRQDESATTTCSPGGVKAARLDDDRWAPIESPDSGIFEARPNRDVSFRAAVWNGREVVGIIDGHPFALDIASKRWRELAPIPTRVNPDAVCPTDHGVVVLDVHEKADLETGPSLAVVLRDDKWTRVFEAPTPATLFAAGACVGGGAVVVPSRSTTEPAAWFDGETEAWSMLPPPPIVFPDLIRPTDGTGDAALFDVDRTVLELDVVDRQWRERTPKLAPGDAVIAALDGETLIVRTGTYPSNAFYVLKTTSQ